MAAAISGGVFLIIAGVLILSQKPDGIVEGESLGFQTGGPPPVVPLTEFTARDGATLAFRDLPGDEPPIVLIHGSGWHGAAYETLGRAVADRTGRRVVIPDLRGHGPFANPRGDIRYIRQLEDDMADLAAHIGAERADFVGHSSGGGLTIRLAGGPYRDLMNKAVLIAPFLRYNAPTARDDSHWAEPQIRRIIGLSMLNTAGIRALNGLKVIEFNLPQEVLNSEQGQWATQSYSYRLNTGFAPRAKYLEDIAALPPFLLLAGELDEAFRADQYEPVMSGVSDAGSYELMQGLGHLDILNDPETAQRIAAFLAE
ncbi:alpha/beta fold hydrolase [Maritimibacter dapengensis]|uniref:Alpha/beta hydrolase n=1 Tax=Maritimibacter dapengensis TaxID=2836868 RepID=A0ABS6T3V5_9RHOB|nr:alpha/beta hydrolase [Maritimibacter dapengensis]MBV7379913.1 alpha/beta hydrolase [Maritimibacter dapengensis]